MPSVPPLLDGRREAARRGPARILQVRRAEALALIHSHGVGLVCWQRALSPHLGRWLAGLPLSALAGGRSICDLDRLGAVVAALTDDWPGGLGRAQFRRDLERLGRRFAAVARTRWIRLRLEPVGHDACRLLHVDHVPLRLVTTYCGEGTQYLPPDGVSLDAEGRPQFDLARLQSLPAGHVALFRGLAEGQGNPPLVLHRSPPLAGTGRWRLLLALDAAAPPEV